LESNKNFLLFSFNRFTKLEFAIKESLKANFQFFPKLKILFVEFKKRENKIVYLLYSYSQFFSDLEKKINHSIPSNNFSPVFSSFILISLIGLFNINISKVALTLADFKCPLIVEKFEEPKTTCM